MIGVLVLTPEEDEIVRLGSLDEPSYRPFPSGSTAKREREGEMWLDEHPGEGERAREVPPKPQLFVRIVSAHWWRRHHSGETLLLSRDEAGNLRLIGVAAVQGGPRAHAPGTRHLRVGPWSVFDERIELSRVLGLMERRQSTDIARVVVDRARPLPPKAGRELLAALQTYVPDISRRLDDVHINPQATPRTPDTTPEARDAFITALRFFTPSWRQLDPVESPVESPLALEIELAVAEGYEDEYITDDAAVFLDWNRSDRSDRGWWQFIKDDRRLMVKNVNATPHEQRSGADLVYVSQDPDFAVLVQYKVLEALRDGDLVFRDDGRVHGQLERLGLTRNNAPASRFDDVRLSSEFTFVKFIDPHVRVDPDSRDLLPGYYLPASAVHFILQQPELGPRGGALWHIPRYRHIDSQTMAKLVQGAWVGSTGNATALIREALRLAPRPSSHITVAVEEPGVP